MSSIEPPAPAPFVQATGYVVSCLPEGHDDRFTFTIQVRYTGRDQWAVKHGIRHYSADGTWAYEPDFDEDDDAEAAWAAAHRFDHDTALRIAREQAPLLSYRGHTVAAALADTPPEPSGPVAPSRAPAAPLTAPQGSEGVLDHRDAHDAAHGR